jgi:haloalkane dehalogenase
MDFLETPAHRFADLPDYPFEPNFVEVDPRGLRMHFVDEGPRDGAVVLMLHGEPSWSYLYRSMIPPCVEAGLRVVAPDLIGFGKSSKPTRISDYTYAAHCDWVHALIEKLELSGITLFGQDWGSLIGLRLAAQMEPRFSAIVIGNGFLPEGKKIGTGMKGLLSGAAFLAWRTYARFVPRFSCAAIVSAGAGRKLGEGERRAYDAPFPDDRYLAGARAFPRLVPISPRDPAVPANRAAWKVLERWEKPFVTAFSSGDPITRGLHRPLRRRIPGAARSTHHTVRGGHFLQEVSGPELAQIVIDTARQRSSSVRNSASSPSSE